MLKGEIIKDRRLYPRFEVDISSDSLDIQTGLDIHGNTHDISSRGIGLVITKEVVLGARFVICLSVPQDQEEIRVRGEVVWVKKFGTNIYRVGLSLERVELKPIPIVLKSIQLKNSRYYC